MSSLDHHGVNEDIFGTGCCKWIPPGMDSWWWGGRKCGDIQKSASWRSTGILYFLHMRKVPLLLAKGREDAVSLTNEWQRGGTQGGIYILCTIYISGGFSIWASHVSNWKDSIDNLRKDHTFLCLWPYEWMIKIRNKALRGLRIFILSHVQSLWYKEVQNQANFS